jgi:signal transduction histidine kinase
MRNTPASSEVDALVRIHALMTQVQELDAFDAALNTLTRGAAEITGFGVVAVSVLRHDGLVEFRSVAGNARARELLQVGDTAALWEVEPEEKPHERWGMFRFVSHEHFEGWDGPMYLPEGGPDDRPDAWHPYDTLHAPLHGSQGSLLGFLHVDDPPGGVRPDESVLRQLDMLALQTAMVLRAQRERDDLRDQVRLAQLGQKLLVLTSDATDTVDELLAAYAEVLRGDLGATRASICLLEMEGDGPSGLWSAALEQGPPVSAEMAEAVERLARRAWARRDVLVMSIADSRPDLLPQPHQSALNQGLKERGVAHALLAPIGAGSELIGYLFLTRRTSRTGWTAAETRTALMAARDLGGALLNRQLAEREHQYTEHLRELDENKRVLFATISHEFKGPIAAISGHAELLDDSLEGEGMLDRVSSRISVDSIGRNARRLSDMVEDLMVLQEVEDPGRVAARAAVDVWAAVAEAVDVWRLQAELMDVRLEAPEPTEPVIAWAERTEVGRVVVNLVSNAVKYSRPGGTVRLELTNDRDRIRFKCSDEGIGISKEDQVRLFDQFFRGGDAAVRRKPGTGLGLSIVRRIVLQLDGDIEVESEVGVGSTFTLTLPRAKR